jgi:PAS domain S-box-containing protein
MARSREFSMSEKARRRRRKEERLPPHEPREPADRPVEELLQQTEQKFRTILDHTSDGVFLLDLEARKFTMCNPSCLQMLGYTADEFAQLRIEDLHPPADLPFVLAQIEEFLQGRKGIRHDIRFKRKDGSILVADLIPELVQLDEKRYVVVALKDITERKRMEEELRRYAEHLKELVDTRTRALQESEARYRSLAENAPDIIQRFDRDLRHLYVNPAFEQATGLSPSAVIGKTDRESGLPEDLIPLWEQAARAVFRTGESQSIVFEMPTPRGPRHYEARLVPEFAPDGSTEHVLAITRDVTERTHAEEALRFTQFAIDHTADAAFWMTEDARFFYVNEAACQALGYSRDELLQMTVYDIDPAFTESMWRANWRRLKAQKSIVFETVHRTRDGRVYPVEIRANYLEFGGRAYDCAFARDITERKRAEEALQFTQFAIDHTADAAFWMTEDGRFFYVNEAACRALGYSRDELLQMTVYDIDPAFTKSMWRDSWCRLKLDKSRVFETVHRARDGRIYPVEIRVNYLEFGGREYHCAFARDITERKRAEEALRESEERFRAAFEEGAVAMALTALDTTLLKVNSSFCRMIGFSELELVGRSFLEITHPDDRAPNLVGSRRLASGEISSFRMEKRYFRKDGVVVWADMNMASVRDAQGRPLYCVTHVQDITDRKQAEEALRRLNEQLELQVARRTEDLRHTVDRLRQSTLELSQAEDRECRRIADILHDDVQQTLAAAKFHLNLLGRAPHSAAESQKIIAQARQMLGDAIEKSRSLSHELSPALYQVDLAALLEGLAQHMQQKHGLLVRVAVHDPVNASPEPVRALLYKVARELLFNVVKHAGVHEARLRVRRRGPCLYLSVADRGRGFDPEKLEGAAGFGLLNIRERVQLLGGWMKIRSRPGRGSRFLIAFPDQSASPDTAPTECFDGRTAPADAEVDWSVPQDKKRAGA